MPEWSETIWLSEKTTIQTEHDELLLSAPSANGLNLKITVGRVGNGSDEEDGLEVGDVFEYGPYTFGHFEIRVLELSEDPNRVKLLVTRLE